MRTLHTQQFVKENIYQLVELHAVLENTLKVLSFHEALTPSSEEDKTSSGINPFLSKREAQARCPQTSQLWMTQSKLIFIISSVAFHLYKVTKKLPFSLSPNIPADCTQQRNHPFIRSAEINRCENKWAGFQSNTFITPTHFEIFTAMTTEAGETSWSFRSQMEFTVRRKNFFLFLNHVLTCKLHKTDLEFAERKNEHWHPGTVTFTATFQSIKPLRTKHIWLKSISVDKPGMLPAASKGKMESY